MPAKSSPAWNEMDTRDLWKIAVFCTFVFAVLLVTSFLILGKQEWPDWLTWAARALVGGLLIVLWHSSAWQLMRELRRRAGRGRRARRQSPGARFLTPSTAQTASRFPS